MPIEPPYTWEESPTELRVYVVLLGAKPSVCDVSVADNYVKVNQLPSLLALDLFAAVVDTASTVSFTPEGLTLNLPKAKPQLWKQLKADPEMHGGKAGLAKRRKASIERQRAAAEAARQQRIVQRSVHKRLATHSQIDLDNKQRDLIDDRKADEKRVAEESVYAQLDAVEQGIRGPEDDEWESETDEEVSETETVRRPAEPAEPVAPEAPVEAFPLRSLKPCAISFTKNDKPDHMQHLPARTKPEDLPRNETALKPRNDDAVDLGEQNALFLKDRGDGFFGKRDYEAAVNAYSAALTLDRNLPAVYSNRAACFFCLSDHQKCVEDCTFALRLLRNKLVDLSSEGSNPATIDVTPVLQDSVDATNRSLLRVLARRASARSLLKKHQGAIEDYTEAVELDPSNVALQADLQAEQLALMASNAEEVLAIKAEADALFAQAEYSSAKVQYTAALKLDAVHVGCLSNRAACQLLLGNDAGTVADCTAALEVLRGDGGGQEVEGAAAEKQKRTRLRLHVRRGTALARSGQRDAAQAEYEACEALGVASAAELAQLQHDLGESLQPEERPSTPPTQQQALHVPHDSPMAG